MRIGGFQPFTLSDFPGHTAAIVFTQGCNFRCPYCHNAALWPLSTAFGPTGLSEQTTPDDAAVLRFLDARRGLLDGLVVSGGEPTLQHDLRDFLSQVKRMGLATKLDTNGSRPEVLAALFRESLLDYVAMDIKGPADRYEQLAGKAVDMTAIERSVRLIARSGVAHHFRTTWVAPLLRETDRAGILTLVPSGSLHVWQTFRPELAVDRDLQRTA